MGWILRQIYKKVYTSPLKGHEDPYFLPKGKAYEEIVPRVREMVDYAGSVPFEPVTILSEDGISLYGRYYEGRSGAPFILAFHGYASPAYRDCGLSLKLRDLLGYSVLIPDQRGQGKSGGETMTFGAMESRDVISWCRYVNERFGADVRIGLCGLSMGASSVILAVEQGDCPGNVVGVFADSPFSSGEHVIRSVIRSMHIPGSFAYKAVEKAGERYGGFRMADTDCAAHADRIRVPVKLVHGEDDSFVPCRMSREIRDANPKMVSLSIFPGAEHGTSYMVDPQRYEQENAAFWQRLFGEEPREAAGSGNENRTDGETAEKQIGRICYYESVLDHAEQALKAEAEPENDPELAGKIRELDAYYGSEEWKRDFAADEAGILPPDLKRGVLSEDGIYNVLQEYAEKRKN